MNDKKKTVKVHIFEVDGNFAAVTNGICYPTVFVGDSRESVIEHIDANMDIFFCEDPSARPEVEFVDKNGDDIDMLDGDVRRAINDLVKRL